MPVYLFILVWLCGVCGLLADSAHARDIWLAPGGSDTAAGTAAAPWATLTGAVAAAQPGDTIWLRAGIYRPKSETILKQSGTREAPITLAAQAGGKVVIDLQGQNRCAIRVRGAWWRLRDLTIQNAGQCAVRIVGSAAHDNVLTNITAVGCTANGIDLTSGTTGNTLLQCGATGCGHNGIRITGGAAHNTVRLARAWRNQNTGIQLDAGAAVNLVEDCDAWENYDPPTHGQNADGFGIKFALGAGNILRGCRAWHNADDGYDCWHAGAGVRFEQCYAWRNGENLWHDAAWEGNGNGFKLGQLEGAHVLVRCAAWDQAQRGFDLNGNSSGVTLLNCTAVRCGSPFGFTFVKGNSEKNVLHNCLALGGTVKIDPRMDQRGNSWNTSGAAISEADFASLDSKTMEGPRASNGPVPATAFLHLARGSRAIDAGRNVGLPYTGKAPDLGAFETATAN